MIYTLTKQSKNLKNINIPPQTTELYAEYICLESLIGCPDHIKKFRLKGNNLTSFSGFPEGTTHIDISDNNISTIIGCPQSVRHLNVSSTRIINLSGCHEGLVSLDCSYTHIKSFEGANQDLIEIIAKFTKATTMKGLPTKMIKAYLSYNYISNCDYCPEADLLDLSYNRITSLEGCKCKYNIISTGNHIK